MLAPILIFVGVLITAVSGAAGGWAIAARQRSGTIATSEAKDLWDVVVAELAASRVTIVDLRTTLDRTDERLRKCQDQVMTVRVRELRKDAELSRLRRQIAALTGKPYEHDEQEEGTG